MYSYFFSHINMNAFNWKRVSIRQLWYQTLVSLPHSDVRFFMSMRISRSLNFKPDASKQLLISEAPLNNRFYLYFLYYIYPIYLSCKTKGLIFPFFIFWYLFFNYLLSFFYLNFIFAVDSSGRISIATSLFI